MRFGRVPGTVVEVEGLDRANAPLRAWFQTCLGPLADPAPRPTDVRIRIAPRLDGEEDGLGRFPITPCSGGLLVTDPGGRGAAFDLTRPRAPVIVDAAMDPGFFETRVFVPLVRAALWRQAHCLVRGAAIEMDGSRVALTGWAKTGKTTLLLDLLSRGAAFCGDDWLALTRDGTIAPIMAQVLERDVHRDAGRARAWLSSTGRTIARRSRRPKVSRVLDRLAALTEDSGDRRIGVTDAVPDARIADPGPLAALIVLTHKGGRRAQDANDAAEILGGLGAVHTDPCVALESAQRTCYPGNRALTVFPDREPERRAITAALRGVHVVSIPAEDADVERIAAIVADVAQAEGPPRLRSVAGGARA